MMAAIQRQLVRLAIRYYIRRKRRRIRDKPSVRDRMNLRLAEMLRQCYGRGNRFLLSGFLFPAELAHLCGATPMFTETLAALVAGQGFGTRALGAADSIGFSRDGCSFHRATLGAGLQNLLPRPLMVVATSHLCDGQGKALEMLADHFRSPYFLLDVPQERSPAAVDYLAGQLEELEERLVALTGIRPGPGDWRRAFAFSNETRELMLRVAELRRRRPSPMYGLRAFNIAFQALLIFGTRFLRDCYRDLVGELEAAGATGKAGGEKYRVIWLLSYPYFRNHFMPYLEDELGVHAVAEELGYTYWPPLDPARPHRSLAAKMLSNPNLGSVEKRVALIEKLVRDYEAEGVIHYSHWGCRQGCGGVRPIADAVRRLGVPFLDLDGDSIDDRNYSEGQTRTRLEGFVELMERGTRRGREVARKDALFLGIDIGSLSAEAVAVDAAGRIVAQELILTGASSRRAAERLEELVLDGNGLRGRIDGCVATGYGRGAVAYADERITEIACHARGMAHRVGGVRTIVDIGGQDTKAMAVEPDGTVRSFLMNDKCAAGTGRFLEVMARTLEIDLEEFGPRALAARRAVAVSSMCTVFAESEVVSLIAEGAPIEEIARGVCDSIAARTAALLARVGKEKKIAMSGGVARNVGVVKALERALGARIVIPSEPQMIGALGASLLARDRAV